MARVRELAEHESVKRRSRWRTVAYVGLGIAALGVTLGVGMWIGYSNVHTCVCVSVQKVT